MTNTKKELDWDNPGQPEAEELFRSGRGGYIVGQALYKAIEVMEQEEHPEYSNIADMKLIMNHMYPIFSQFAAGLETFKKMREAGIEGLDLTGKIELTGEQQACLSVQHLELYTKNRGKRIIEAREQQKRWRAAALPVPTNRAQRELSERIVKEGLHEIVEEHFPGVLGEATN